MTFNLDKIAAHGVTVEECQWVIEKSRPSKAGEKFIAVGRTRSGRKIKAIYVMDDAMTVFVITAYPI